MNTIKQFATTILFSGISVVAQASTTEVTIAGWGGNDVVVVNKLINEVLVDDLKKAGITIKYQAIEGDYSQYIVNALSANTAPDAFYMDVIFADSYVKSGKIIPNSASTQAIAKQHIPNLNAAFTLNNQQYGLAKDFNTIAMLYNKDIFDDAGVDYPTNQDSWEDLRKKLLAIKAVLGEEVSGLCVMSDYARFAPFALATGWTPFNKDGKTVLDENFTRAFDFYTGLVTKDKVGVLAADVGQSWGGGCFGTEETAVTFEGNWVSGYLRDKAPNLPYGTTMMPVDPITKERGNLLFSVAWVINANSKDMAATEKAVEILVSEKAQQWVLSSGLALPSMASLSSSDFFQQDNPENQLAQQIFEGARSGRVEPYSFGEHGVAWTTPINEALNSVMMGQLTSKEAIALAQKKYDALIATH